KSPNLHPLLLVPPVYILDKECYNLHHLDFSPLFSYSNAMQEAPIIPCSQEAPSAQDFSKLGFVYIAVLELANQVYPILELDVP
ncbi:hypothetical protein DSO57_1015510, partial [Entomophthora muscae]